MICGANSRCKCSSGSIEQLEFDIQGFVQSCLQGAAVSIRRFGDLEIALLDLADKIVCVI